MQFGLFLVHRRVITCNQFVTAMELQKASRPPIGQLALDHEKLAVQQIMQLLAAQSDNPQELFGELAVELGMLSEADLSELVKLQSDLIKPMAEIVVELGFVSEEKAAEELAEYRKAMEEVATADSAVIV